MSCNLFDRIINAIRPGRESEQPSDTSEPWPPELQTDDTTQQSPEDLTESSEASEEPSPDFQEAVNPAHPHQCQD
jgi:hypothetical protein